MARRWYLTRIIGTGSEEDPYRSVLVDQPTINDSAVIPTGPDGHPLSDWCLAVADEDRGSNLAALSDVEALPAAALNARLSTLPIVTRQRIATLANEHLGTRLTVGQGPMAPNATLRDVIGAIGRHLQPGFTVDE